LVWWWRGEVGFLQREKLAEFKCGLGFAKAIFWGFGFGKTETEFSRPQKGVWGMNAGGLGSGFLKGRLAIQKYL
jgi:hypothetical protein